MQAQFFEQGGAMFPAMEIDQDLAPATGVGLQADPGAQLIGQLFLKPGRIARDGPRAGALACLRA